MDQRLLFYCQAYPRRHKPLTIRCSGDPETIDNSDPVWHNRRMTEPKRTPVPRKFRWEWGDIIIHKDGKIPKKPKKKRKRAEEEPDRSQE